MRNNILLLLLMSSQSPVQSTSISVQQQHPADRLLAINHNIQVSVHDSVCRLTFFYAAAVRAESLLTLPVSLPLTHQTPYMPTHKHL
mmetsp:Transcript_15083/g.24015  ORF Transcript_15083/g.24015 Transcript_15083/m.24015 type:complete len:87 (+) Transcript_15083:294-554(+)